MQSPLRVRALVAAAAAVVVGALPAVAAADVNPLYWDLASTGAASPGSGFVEVARADGPTIYSHEMAVLNRAAPNALYTLTRHFFFQDPDCDGGLVFASDVARLQTNRVGDATADFFVAPEEAAGLVGVHGITWTVKDATGSIAYRSACKAVTLD